ncbi:MAG: tetratricopeptide repeat protein [Gammaproteobacteria bacterium]|nr:tetratricopeptide repeat protein [Gammaproteobacteria bacterium]
MSLINKMLQDLESRSNTRENTVNKKNAYEGLKPVKAARFRTPPRRLMVMIFAVLLIGAGVYVWLQWGERLFSDNLVAMGKTQPVTVRKAVPKPAAMVAATPVPPAVAPAIPVAASAPAAAMKQEKLPAGTQIAPVAPAPTPVVEAKKETPSVSSPTPAASEPKSIPSDGYWTVSRGETLYGISTKTGIDLWDLSKWNHLGRNHVVHVGQRLRLTPPASAAAKADMNQSVNKPNTQKAAKKKEKVFVASADSSVIDGAAAAPEQNSADMAVMDKKLKPLSTDEKSEDEYRVGINFLQQGRSSDAEKHLRLAVTANAEHVKARELLAGLALQSGHVQEAEQLLEQGIAKVPAHYPFAQLLARVYVDHGSEPKALAVMEASRKAGAASAEYMAFLAALYQRAGKHAEAVKAYSDAVTLNPQESRSWLGMGISLEATQDWNGAGAAYQHAIDAGTLDSKLLQYAQQRLQIVKNK